MLRGSGIVDACASRARLSQCLALKKLSDMSDGPQFA